MAGIKISQLDSVPGGTVASIDQLPVARGDSTYRISAGQFVVDGVNIGVGPGQIYSDKTAGAGTTLMFRSLSAEEGLSIRTAGNTMVVSASGQNPTKTAFIGTGARTTWPINDAKSINANNYRVTIDGVVQEPLADYTINGTNIVFSDAPPLSGNVVVVSNNLVRAFDVIPSDGSVTTNKLALSAVTTATINNNAVTTEKINPGAVTNSRIAYDGGSFCFRNKIINGDMRIDQRNNGAAVTVGNNTVPYIVDRFYAFSGINPGTTATAQRVATGNSNLPFALRMTAGSNTSQMNIGQRIESANVYDLIGQTVTFSFYASSPSLTNLGIFIYTPNSVDSYGSGSTTFFVGNAFVINNSLTRYSYNFVVPAAAVNGIAIELYVSGPSAALPPALPVGSSLTITGVQLEAGPTATPFEYRPIGTELALCQRYFSSTQVLPGGLNGTSSVLLFWTNSVPMRTSPTVSWPGTLNINALAVASGNTAGQPHSLAMYNNLISFQVSNPTTAGAGFCWASANTGVVSFNAELQ
jgi:hypothetical protein